MLRASAISSSASATLAASGFSISTSTPLSISLPATARCATVGTATDTACTPAAISSSGEAKRPRAEFLGDCLRARVVAVRNADEFNVLRGILLQLAINAGMIAPEGAAAHHSDAQGAVSTGHSLILADSPAPKQNSGFLPNPASRR